MKRNLPFGTKVVPGNTPGAAAGNGIVIDRLGYRSALIGLAAATIAADSSVVAKIQHGSLADGSDMADFKPDGAIISTDTLSTSDTNTFKDVDLSGAKRYVRLVTSTTGTAPSFSSYVVLGDDQYGDGFNG
ncbi:hypothetical protein [Clostridium magnum]|uniref:hypothetical protein n=1 Tax=Clostridium magnum TaxID=33954 RepID=UPI0009231891|nr:hypothetical protein [Clostridium magnum]SHJ29300.1 hypothetical protein SAMN02745944_05706 [Clostridium magnum DSM 2767]